jgi:hypothetical protein
MEFKTFKPFKTFVTIGTTGARGTLDLRDLRGETSERNCTTEAQSSQSSEDFLIKDSFSLRPRPACADTQTGVSAVNFCIFSDRVPWTADRPVARLRSAVVYWNDWNHSLR